MKNKLLTMLLMTTMVFTFAACGSETEQGDGGSEPVQQDEPKEEKEPEATVGEKNALKAAENYLSFMAFSKSGLIKQLEFENYTEKEAKYAAEHCRANWKEQAEKAAKNYLDSMPFSKQELIDQLKFDGFTQKQAEYGVEKSYE